MSSLWIPNGTRCPDVDNFFDMALAMQEILTGIDDLDQRANHAQFAIEALGEHLCRFGANERTLSLHSNTALYNAEPDAVRIVQDIGIRGELDGVSYIQLDQLAFGISLTVASTETFTPSNPDDSEPTKLTLQAPITSVQYVELVA